MTATVRNARIAGFLYLLVIVFGIFAQGVVRSSLIVPGKALETANAIMSSEGLFRAGFISDLMMMMCYLLMAFMLYTIFESVNKNLALLFMLLTLASVAIMCLNMLNQFACLLLLSGADYLKVFTPDQIHALVLLFLNLHEYGYLIAQMFSSAWLLPLGYLGYKSGYFPKILGILVMTACFAELFEFFQMFLFPAYEFLSSPGIVIAVVAEFALCFWLMFKGVNLPKIALAQA